VLSPQHLVLLWQAGEGLQDLFHPPCRQLRRRDPPPLLPKKRGDLQEILHQRTLRPVKGAPPDERPILNPNQMDLVGNGSRLFDGKGLPFSLPETVEIPNHDPLRPQFVSDIAQDLPERILEGRRGNPSVGPGDTFSRNDVQFRVAFFQIFQEAFLDDRLRAPGGLRCAENRPAEGAAHDALERVFRNDLLKGNDGDPVEDDPPLWNRAALILAMAAAEERLKETEDQEAVDNLSDTIGFFDGFNPLVSDGGSFLLCRGNTAASAPSIINLQPSREPLVDRTPSIR